MFSNSIRGLMLGAALLAALLAGCDTAPAPTPTPVAPSATAVLRTPTMVPPTSTPLPSTALPSPSLPAETPEPLVSVRFDVALPPDTPLTDTIYVSGNFQGTVDRAAPLTRAGDHAAGSVPAAAGRALEFRFTRGSLTTVEKTADCSDSATHHAEAVAGSIITATVAAWADHCVPLYDARVQRVELSSRALGIPKAFYVYTPPGYAETPSARYPVLYLFRGHEREWINKREDTSRAGQNVIDVYETLLAAHQVGPLILVFPGISSTDDTVSGMLMNLRAPQLAQTDGIGSGRFEDYFLQELLPHVDAHYRTIAARGGRGVDGFSLGGFMSAKIVAAHPDLFSTVGAFDGLYFYADSTCRRVDTDRETVFNYSMFAPAFGDPPDPVVAAANNPPNLVCNSTPAAMQSLHWFIQYGPESAEPNNSNYYRGVHLMKQLQAKGVQNGIPPILTGGHKWATADAHMRQTLPLHWAVLGQPIPGP